MLNNFKPSPGRPGLTKNDSGPNSKEIAVYPQVVRTGGSIRSFEGYNSDIFLSPMAGGRWGRGTMPFQIREQMLAHDKVSQSINNFKAAVLGDGGRSIPCVPPSHVDFDFARKISDFSDRLFRNTRTSYYQTAWQLLDCIYEGNKVTPKSWRDVTYGVDKGKRVLDALHVWPNELYEFIQDEFGNVLRIKTQSSHNRDLQKEWDRGKFLVLTFRPRNGSPTGETVLDAAYGPFVDDMAVDMEESAYLAQFSRPSVAVFAPEPPKLQNGMHAKTELVPLFDIRGEPIWMPDPEAPDSGVMVQMKGTMVQQNSILFQNWQSGSVWSLAGGSKVQIAEASAGGADMFRFKRESNFRRMAGAIYGTHQMTESERNVSTNNAEVGEGVAGLNITYAKAMLEQAEENDILREAVFMNFGRVGMDYIPLRDYGSGQNGRMPKVMNAQVGFASNGAMTEDQYYWFCAGNGLPLPYPESKRLVVATTGTGGGDKTGAAKPNPDAE